MSRKIRGSGIIESLARCSGLSPDKSEISFSRCRYAARRMNRDYLVSFHPESLAPMATTTRCVVLFGDAFRSCRSKLDTRRVMVLMAAIISGRRRHGFVLSSTPRKLSTIRVHFLRTSHRKYPLDSDSCRSSMTSGRFGVSSKACTRI